VPEAADVSSRPAGRPRRTSPREHIGEEFLGRRMAGRFFLLHDARDTYLEEFVEV
jgi:hypothetical protein